MKTKKLVKDMQAITDAARGKKFSNFMMGLALLKNYKPFRAPRSLALTDLLKKFDKSFALTGESRARKKYGASDPNRTYADALKCRSDPWNFLAEWYKTHGKHRIYAKGKSVELESAPHSLDVNPAHAARVRPKEHDIPITAAEEERQRRKAAWEAQPARLYVDELLLKRPQPGLVQINAAAPEVEEKVPV